MPNLIFHFVYGLTDPRFEGIISVRYVGVTTILNERYRTHLSCPKHDPVDKNEWVKDVLASGLEPGMEIIEIYKASYNKARALAHQRETHWIQHYKALGANLLNSHKMNTQVPGIAGLVEKEFLEFDPLDDELLKLLSKYPSFAFGDF